MPPRALAAAAHEALTSPEKDRAHTILRRADSAPTVQEPPTVVAAVPPVSAPTSEGGSPSESPARQRKRWPIVAAAVVVVAVVAGAGIWLATKPSEPSAAPAHNQGRAGAGKTAPQSSPAPSDTQARLLSLVPPGYVAGACTAATAESGSIWTTATAMVTCGQNNQPGGPSKATYGLFPTPATLKKAFKDDIANVSLVNCPGEDASPVSWHYDPTPNDMAGIIACGNYGQSSGFTYSVSVPQHTCMRLLKGTSHAIPPHGVEYHQLLNITSQLVDLVKWLLTAPVTSATERLIRPTAVGSS
jgi:serine/threonine kinase PknH